jgi:HlyD family secretion protein
MRALIACLLVVAACGRGGAQDKDRRPDAGDRGVAVDLQVARRGQLVPPVEVVGTTRPRNEVVVRTRVEGRLLTLRADVGDVVKKGQLLARLEDDLPRQALREALAELASVRAQASAASAARAQARLSLSQAQVEAERYAELSKKGIASRQDAEQRATAARTTAQQLESQGAQVAASQAQVAAQQALVAQARERLSYVEITSPIDGRVLERLSEPGNLLAIGDSVLRIGDLGAVEVVASISELDLGRVAVGRQVPVRLDAFPDETFRGVIERVSPQADPVSRLVPVEVLVPNPEGRIGAGLLARAQLGVENAPRVLISAVALRVAGRQGEGGATVFVVDPSKPPLVARARAVKLGREGDAQVEVLEGLDAGERVVTRSERPLSDGTRVRASAVSELGSPEGDAGAAGAKTGTAQGGGP